ncbi:MAG TPA: mevalonate kinase [Nitrososphaeraceae archaeon]|nr:mevalonate kinase [Nitrososphaeraceae archaeon]
MNTHTNLAVSSAPAKVILFGEHFVVYNNPAIVAAINRRIRVQVQLNDKSRINIRSGENSLSVPVDSNDHYTMSHDTNSISLFPIFKCIKYVFKEKSLFNVGANLEIESQIPYGEGLGSSAASCVSSVAALYSLFYNFDKTQIYETARIMEQNIHTNSSGVDCYVSTFGGIVNFEPDKGFSYEIPKKKFTLLIGISGIKHSTGKVVSQVRQFRQENSSVFKDLTSKAREICKSAVISMNQGDESELGNLLSENHKLLASLGVSHPEIEKMIETCLDNGAFGAKLTGAGMGGAVIALIPNDLGNEILAKMSKGPGKWMLVELDYDGVTLG